MQAPHNTTDLTPASGNDLPILATPTEDNTKTSNPAETRRELLHSGLALGLTSLTPRWALANSPANNQPPQTLEKRLSNTSFVLVGVLTKLMHVPNSAYATYFKTREKDPEYIRLEKEGGSEEDYRKYYEAHPVDADAFRLREDHEEIEGQAITFVECDIKKILFKRGLPSHPKMGTTGKRIYIQIGGDYRAGIGYMDKYRSPWLAFLGKKMILLSDGAPYLFRNSSYIPFPYPVQWLTSGNHILDRFPIPFTELSKVIEIATQLGFIRIDKP